MRQVGISSEICSSYGHILIEIIFFVLLQMSLNMQQRKLWFDGFPIFVGAQVISGYQTWGRRSNRYFHKLDSIVNVS